MGTLEITRGLPGSGKTTWALRQVAADPTGNTVRVNRDELRMEMFGEYHFTGPRAEVGRKEGLVTQEQEKRVRDSLRQGKRVVVDDTNLFHEAPYKWRRLAEEFEGGVQFKVHDVPTSFEECVRRDQKRMSQGERGVGQNALNSMQARYLKNGRLPFLQKHLVAPIPTPPEKVENGVIFDVDGTLCDVRSVRHHVRPAVGKKRNFHGFHMDSLYCPPNKQVVDFLMECKDNDLKVIIVTARDEKYRGLTEKWLELNNIPYDGIFVRNYGDTRPDYEAKKEILADVRKFYNPVHAVDDNPQVLQLWKEENIQTTIVAGFDDPVDYDQGSYPEIPIENFISGGKCLKCGRKMKRDGVLGPECEKK